MLLSCPFGSRMAFQIPIWMLEDREIWGERLFPVWNITAFIPLLLFMVKIHH